MRRVLVTGANKGIGFAIGRGVLERDQDTFLLLGSRDPGRGEAALERLVAEDAGWTDRAMVLELDVSDDESVRAAARTVRDTFSGEEHPLYGVVNNAGVGRSAGSLRAVLDVNTVGVHRVCEAFLPMLPPGEGRIVNVTSASGPSFVSRCSPERQRFFLDPDTSWEDLEELMAECIAIDGDEAAFRERGLDDGDAYGLSKACSNTYTQHLATQHPQLRIHACTPGFIATDMTRGYAEAEGKSPADMGMKPPAEGARTPLFLLFGDPAGNGWYWGSDAKRSPMHEYRSPGSPEYRPDEG